MKKIIIRPFNVTSAFLMFIAILMSAVPIALLAFVCLGDYSLDIKNIIVIPSSFIMLWVGILLLSIVFHQKTIFFDTYLEVYSWKYGTPYKRNMKTSEQIKLPKVKITRIEYSDLKMYGAYLAKDISQYIHKNSGFLQEQWMIANSFIPIPIKMPKVTSSLRDVLLFVKTDGSSIVVDGGNYGLKQVKAMFGELENRTNIKPTGLVEGDLKFKRPFCITILNSFLSLFAIIIWTVVFPVSTVWFEGYINSSHIPAYQSGLRTVYVIGFILGGIASLLYYCSLVPTTKKDEDVRSIRKISKIICLIIYPISIIAFILSAVVF